MMPIVVNPVDPLRIGAEEKDPETHANAIEHSWNSVDFVPQNVAAFSGLYIA
jgi:hypothetical protein